MDNRNNMENTEKYPEQIKELFAELVPEAVRDTWLDTFEVESIDGKYVMVTYHGTEKLTEFKKACKGILQTCVYSVLGFGRKVKICRESKLTPKAKKNIKAMQFLAIGMVFVCVAAAIIVVLCNYVGNRHFRETFYSASNIKADSRVRVIQLSDLHCARYGKDNEELVQRVKALNPDIIICTGDIVNSVYEDVDYAVSLAEKLSKIAPSYYIYGNNEVEGIYDVLLNEKDLDEKFGFDSTNRDEAALLKLEDPFEEKLEKAGIKVLKNEKDTIMVKTMAVDVYGVLNSNPSSFWSYSGKAFVNYTDENPDHLKITAVHEPVIFETFEPRYWGDLMISGHTHGGLVRVPVLGPLYTHEGGLFPERSGCFVYGRYNIAGKPLFVSAGLDNSTLYRINNEPELVVIDINKF